MELAKYISTAFESVFNIECPACLLEASEGDAREYMKKALEANGISGELAGRYGAMWAAEAFNDIRDRFVHKGGCDVYFVPGIARIAYGELGYGTGHMDADKVDALAKLVKFISTAHRNDFSRNLERIDTVTEGPRKGMKVRSAPLAFDDIAEMFSRKQKEATEAERAEVEKAGRTDNGYRVIELADFKTANSYYEYTVTDDRGTAWCYLGDEDTFEDYRDSGNRLYLALKDGFERLKPGEPGYGRSMIGFDMGVLKKDGTSEMQVCTNRYNHGKDLEHEEGAGSGDHAYSDVQLSRILGVPVWKDFPGYTAEEQLALGRMDIDGLAEIIRDMDTVRDWASNADFYRKKYGMYAERSNFPIGAYSFYNRRDFIVGYAIEEGDSGKALWVRTISRLPEDRFLVQFADYRYGMIDRNRRLLTGDERFDTAMAYRAERFPIPVGRKMETDSSKYTWNFIDADGHVMLPGWVTNVTQFIPGGYATVRTSDGKMSIINSDMEFVVRGAEIRPVADSNAFLVKKDDRYNFFGAGGQGFDPWADMAVPVDDELYIVSVNAKWTAYNARTGATWPDSYWYVLRAGLIELKNIFIVQRESDHKYNYIVEDGSCKDSRPVFDRWFDMANSFHMSYATSAILDGANVRVCFDGKSLYLENEKGKII